VTAHPPKARSRAASRRSLQSSSLRVAALLLAIFLHAAAPAVPLIGPGTPSGIQAPLRALSLHTRALAADLEGGPSRTSARRSPGDLQVAAQPKHGGLRGAWDSVCRTGVARRLAKVGSWVANGARLLWSIPKAVIQGDSRSLIEAIGDLLSSAGSGPPDGEPQQPVPDPDPSGEPTDGLLLREGASGLN
jgi:hypothetical protein